MSKNRKDVKLVCLEDDEEKLTKVIYEFNFSISNRHDIGIIILELKLPKTYKSRQLKKLINLQDKLLGL